MRAHTAFTRSLLAVVGILLITSAGCSSYLVAIEQDWPGCLPIGRLKFRASGQCKCTCDSDCSCDSCCGCDCCDCECGDACGACDACGECDCCDCTGDCCCEPCDPCVDDPCECNSSGCSPGCRGPQCPLGVLFGPPVVWTDDYGDHSYPGQPKPYSAAFTTAMPPDRFLPVPTQPVFGPPHDEPRYQ